MDIAVELCFVFRGQRSEACHFAEFIHPANIVFIEAQ